MTWRRVAEFTDNPRHGKLVLARTRRLIREAEQPHAYIALLLILAALPIAWGIPRLLRGPQPRHGSIVFAAASSTAWRSRRCGWAWCGSRASSACASTCRWSVFKVAIPILLSLLVIRLTVRVMRVAFPEVRRGARGREDRVVGRLAGRGGVDHRRAAVVHRRAGRSPLEDGREQRQPATILEGAIVAGAVLMVTLWVSSAIEAKMLKGATGQRLSWRKAAANVVRAALVFVGLLLALSAVGIDLTALSVLGGAIGVGLGLGLQKLAANYVSGFVMLAEGALRIGDTVKVDGFEGRISDIHHTLHGAARAQRPRGDRGPTR